MASQQGRDILLKLGDGASPEVFTTVAGLTSKTMSLSNGTVDVTTDDEDGVRTLLAGKYALAASVSASGISKDSATLGTLRTNFLAGTQSNYQVVIPGATAGGTWSFAANITSFEETGETDGAYSFTIALESSGAVALA